MNAEVRIEFEVPFVRGKERPRVVRGHAYTPAGTETSERLIWTSYCDECTAKYGGVVTAPAGVPVRIAVTASGTMPTSRPKRDGDHEPYVYMPDSDNIAKLVLDALNPKTKKRPDGTRDVIRVGAWKDDRQVVRLDVEKVARYRGMPERTVVVIEWSRMEDK